MKILHITNAYPIKSYSSFGIFIKEQIDSLNDPEFQNDFIFINGWEKGKVEYLRSVSKIKKLVKKYDIVHCHHVYSAFTYLLSFSKKPFIFSLLGDINSRPLIDKILFKICKIFSKKVIYKNSLRSDPKMLYLPNGVNLNLFSEIDQIKAKKEIGLDPTKNYILFVSANGIKNKIKRFDKFEQIIKRLSERNYNFIPLVLQGVNREKVPYYYNASDLMLLTSDHEGSPNAVKEAMACNLPVVSTNVGNVSLMLENCKDSFVARLNTVDEMAELVVQSLNLNDHNGRDIIVAKELDMKSTAKKIEKLYREIMKKVKK